MPELSETYEKMTNVPNKAAGNCLSHLANIKTVKLKPWVYVSKAEVLGVPDKILALVAQHPDWGPKKIADSLKSEGISLSKQSIYTFLAKRNLNRISLRESWEKRYYGG